MAFGKERGANTRAQGHHQHRSGTRVHLARTKLHLGLPGGVYIVDYARGAAQSLGEKGIGIYADPAFVDVGGRFHDAAADGGRKPNANGPVPLVLLFNLPHRFHHGRRGSGLGGEHPQALRYQFASFHIHHRTFDAGATNIDTQVFHSWQITNF